MNRGKKVKANCKYCGKDFETLIIKVRQGKGLYCNFLCYQTYRKEKSRDLNISNRLHQKKHKYGLSEIDYLNMFINQNNNCLICEISFDNVRACVDHSHKTGFIRGLLCDKCNIGLGCFKDDIILLSKAITYIKNNS